MHKYIKGFVNLQSLIYFSGCKSTTASHFIITHQI